MYYHADPTATLAISKVNLEWRLMVHTAIRIRKKAGRTALEPSCGETRAFTGIYRRLLDEPFELLLMLE